MWDEIGGGFLIGAAASLLWIGIGRISGMTGVLSSVFMLRDTGRHWALAFLAGRRSVFTVLTPRVRHRVP